jgi:hypothetical protein
LTQNDYPALYRSADALSLASQRRFYQALFLHLLLLLLAAGISVLNSPAPRFAYLQSLLLFGALGCAVYLFLARPERYWYGGRAVSESIKTTAWRYVTRAEPFDGPDELDRSLFSQKLRQIVEQNKDVAQRQIPEQEAVQITSEMDRIRALTLEGRVKHYCCARVGEQLRWYATKAAFNQTVVRRFFFALVLVNFLAMAFAIGRVRFPSAPYWPTDVLVTLAASLLAWVQAKRFQERAASYALASHEISLIREQSGRVRTEQEFSAFVADAENAFSREHTQWVARKDT